MCSDVKHLLYSLFLKSGYFNDDQPHCQNPTSSELATKVWLLCVLNVAYPKVKWFVTFGEGVSYLKAETEICV